jgi:hypothetical protein
MWLARRNKPLIPGVKPLKKAARRSSTLPHPGRSEEHLLKWLAIKQEAARIWYNFARSLQQLSNHNSAYPKASPCSNDVATPAC